MKLTEVATDNLNVDIDVMDAVLAREIQTRLTALGCLDPPADGTFGPVSRLVLGEFEDEGNLINRIAGDAFGRRDRFSAYLAH